ncbi:MAG: 3-deoxy-D-manno-octulosonic acid transferase [Candidatus Latescibacteria bacterium]|nr:3-deoxy-D-manno-octulosonic acid transferase [Candidatus Latescibacterota bacterium]
MIFYTVLTTIILIIAYPVGFILSIFGRTYIRQRLTPPVYICENGFPRIWIHAASVGEAGIAFAMAAEIKQKKPNANIFVSTATETGLHRIKEMEKSNETSVIQDAFIAPFDHPLITGKFVKHINPSLFILVETEIWPAIIRSAYKAHVPVTIINGKISPKALRRYVIARFIFKDIINMISLICVQSRKHARRFHTLGVPEERVEVLGNVKFDSLPEETGYNSSEIRKKLGISGDAQVLVAGSTRPGEEQIIAQAFVRIKSNYPGAVLICAPRHLNRIEEVEKEFKQAMLTYVKRSSGTLFDRNRYSVLLLDTMGELLEVFACADVAFVGGSLRDFGGHNPMEPAALGIPVLFGPYMEQTGSKELLSGGAGALVHDSEELAVTVERLFADGDLRNRMGKAGPEIISKFKGTLARTYSQIESRGLI